MGGMYNVKGHVGCTGDEFLLLLPHLLGTLTHACTSYTVDGEQAGK